MRIDCKATSRETDKLHVGIPMERPSMINFSMCGQEFEVTKRSNTKVSREPMLSLKAKACKGLTASRAKAQRIGLSPKMRLQDSTNPTWSLEHRAIDECTKLGMQN